tara:strand:- start:293 stop:619 length:327 start_codon:yes stop_codon:yes gene_type:complete
MRALLSVLAVLLAGCATVVADEPAGPGPAELAALLSVGRVETPQLRRVRCDFIPEEGSEWACRYEERSGGGFWVGLSTFVAQDRRRWVLIDVPCTADQALADRGLCSR